MIKGAQRAQGEGGGESGFQVIGMTEWDQISKPKKSLGPPANHKKSLDQD